MYKLKVENFMALKDVEVPLGKVTYFCGANESGKSALGHALFLITTGGLLPGTVLENYIRKGTVGFTVELSKDPPIAGLPPASFYVRRTVSGTTWRFDGQPINQRELHERRQEYFFPRMNTLSSKGVRDILSVDRFLKMSDEERVQMLLPEVAGDNLEAELNHFLRQQHDTHLVGRLLSWMNENNLHLNSQAAIKRTVETAVDQRRYSKRRIKELTTVHEALESYLQEHAEEDLTGLADELQTLSAERDNLMQARGAALERSSLLTMMDGQGNVTFDTSGELTSVQQKVVTLVDIRGRLATYQRGLGAMSVWPDRNALIVKIQEYENLLDETAAQIQHWESDKVTKEEQQFTAKEQLNLRQAQKRRSKSIRDFIEGSLAEESVDSCFCCGASNAEAGMHESLEQWKIRYEEGEAERVSAKTIWEALRDDIVKINTDVRNAQHTIETITREKNDLELVMLLDREDTERNIRELTTQSTQLGQEIREELAGQSVSHIDQQIRENEEQARSIRTLMAAFEERERKALELQQHEAEILEHRANIDEMNRFVSFLGAEGILGAYLDSKLTDWASNIQQAANDLTCETRVITPSFQDFDLGQKEVSTDYHIPYSLLSASAALRSRIALGYANCKWTGHPFLVVDNAELHDQLHHTMLRDFLLHSIPDDMCVIFINSGYTPVMAPVPNSAVYLVEEGEVRPY